MKRIVSILAIAVLLVGSAVAKDASPAEKQIADSEAALGQAMIQRDTATLSRLVADDWTIQNDSGITGTKAGFIHDVESRTLVVSQFRLYNLHVRVRGQMAFVQGFDEETSSYNGKVNSGTYNWLDVWENRNDHWVSVATQLTKVETPK